MRGRLRQKGLHFFYQFSHAVGFLNEIGATCFKQFPGQNLFAIFENNQGVFRTSASLPVYPFPGDLLKRLSRRFAYNRAIMGQTLFYGLVEGIQMQQANGINRTRLQTRILITQ